MCLALCAGRIPLLCFVLRLREGGRCICGTLWYYSLVSRRYHVSPAKESWRTKGVYYFEANLSDVKRSACVVSFDIAQLEAMKKSEVEQLVVALEIAQSRRAELVKHNHLTSVHKVIWLVHARDALRTRTNRTLTRNHHYTPYCGARSSSPQSLAGDNSHTSHTMFSFSLFQFSFSCFGHGFIATDHFLENQLPLGRIKCLH